MSNDIRNTVKVIGRNIAARLCRKCSTEIKSGVYCDTCLEGN